MRLRRNHPARKGAARMVVTIHRSLTVTKGGDKKTLAPGSYEVTEYDTVGGRRMSLTTANGPLILNPNTGDNLVGYGASKADWLSAATK